MNNRASMLIALTSVLKAAERSGNVEASDIRAVKQLYEQLRTNRESRSIAPFPLLGAGENPNGYRVYADNSGDDIGVYEELGIGIQDASGKDVAYILVGLSSLDASEPVVHITANGNPDQHQFHIYPLRSAQTALEGN